MRKLALILVFGSVMTFAQVNRFIYEYSFRADSTKTDSLKTEWMYLDVTDKGSVYYSKTAFEADSIINESLKKQLASGTRNISMSRQNYASSITYKVEKSYPSYQSLLITEIGNERYKVTEDRTINWKISSQKKQVGEFNAQKATGQFAGRSWTAWFTTDIPIQEGPYKFHGLPGLIVAVHDGTGSHRMELKGVKKMAAVNQETLDTKGKDIPLIGRKPIMVTRSQYVKLLKQYENDPVQGMRELLNRPNSTVKINVNGTEYSDSKDILKMMEKTARDNLAANNNRIELQP